MEYTQAADDIEQTRHHWVLCNVLTFAKRRFPPGRWIYTQSMVYSIVLKMNSILLSPCQEDINTLQAVLIHLQMLLYHWISILSSIWCHVSPKLNPFWGISLLSNVKSKFQVWSTLHCPSMLNLSLAPKVEVSLAYRCRCMPRNFVLYS